MSHFSLASGCTKAKKGPLYVYMVTEIEKVATARNEKANLVSYIFNLFSESLARSGVRQVRET